MSDEYLVKLTPKTQKYLEETLHETEFTRNVSLEAIRQWLFQNPKLHARTETKYLLPFLRVSNYNMETAKQKLTNFYTMKRDRPEWFSNRNPLLSEIHELTKLGVFVPLKQPNGNKMVIIVRVGAHHPEKYSLNDVLKTGKMILEVATMENELAQIYGLTVIFDMEGVGVLHAKQLSPKIIKRAVHAWQNYHCLPKQLEFINAPFYINVILNIFRSFMSESLNGQVHVHFEGLGNLGESVDLEILPPKYGGKGETMEKLTNYWYGKLVDAAEWFRDDEKYKAE